MKRNETAVAHDHAGIAIVGMAGRFPGALTPAQLWRNISTGQRSISSFTQEELRTRGVDSAALGKPRYVAAGSFLEYYDRFDAAFFGYTPREAEIMDPQHRLILECAWESLEDAGYTEEDRDSLFGVFVGSAFSTYLLHNLYTDPELLELIGEIGIAAANDKDSLASTISYKLNLKGPSVSVQTFCSTSLVAVHLACQSLLTYECDVALAGGVAVQVPQGRGYEYQEGGILSPDGHCRTFDVRAGGSVMGSGVGLVVLRRLEDALREGDQVYAVILGSAVNNDGGMRAGYTAPAVDGQAAVIREALSHAEVDAETIGYVEAHGTATPLGDAVELAAMIKAFGGQARKGTCAIGSIKPNVGHLDRAAGVTGLIKTVQALRHKQLPPQIDFERANPDIDLENSPFYVNTTAREWQRRGTPRRAGVSSFGLGGTNAHVVLEEAPEREASSPARPWELLVVSAKTSAALEEVTTRLADHLAQDRTVNLGDVAYTLQVGRCAFNHRRIVVCRDAEDASAALSARDPERVFTVEQVRRGRQVAFMFPGLGDQYVGMARDLFRVEPAFRAAIDECAGAAQAHMGVDLREIIYPPETATGASVQGTGGDFDLRAMLRRGPARAETLWLKETKLAQPAVFALNYALAHYLGEWGVKPKAVIGHSLGEYVAATLAGVLSLPDAIHLVCKRAELIDALPRGAMLAVALSARDIMPLLSDMLDLAAVNGERATVVAGPSDAIAKLEVLLAEREIACRVMETTHAFHSRMLAPVQVALTELVSGFTLRAPTIPCVSNVSGTWLTASQATDPEYWGRHMCSPVRFSDGLRCLLEDRDTMILEVGPGQSLGSFAKQHPACGADRVTSIVSTIPLVHVRQSDLAFLQTALGRLWLGGVDLDWKRGRGQERRRRISFPTYPFERQRHWREPKRPVRPSAAPSKPSSEKQADLMRWFHEPFWIEAEVPRKRVLAGEPVVLFSDGSVLVERLATRLEADGLRIIRVEAGDAFTANGVARLTIRSAEPSDYAALLEAASTGERRPRIFVHAWTAAPSGADVSDPTSEVIKRGLDRGFYSMLSLGKALARLRAAGPIDIVVLSSGVQPAGRVAIRAPAEAALDGICRVLPQECAGITCRIIDPGWTQGETVSDALIESLASELASVPKERCVSFREGRRHALTFRPIGFTDESARRPWRERGVYIITGGLGGISLVLARYLAETTRARIALLGRSPFPERDSWESWLAAHNDADPTCHRIRKLIEIERLGGDVMVLCADVADEPQLRRALEEVRSRWGALHGVIHAAGVSEPAAFAPIRDLERWQCETHFSAKIYGLCSLDRLTRDDDLDFRVAFSSLSGILGGLSLAAYAAANAFMDAFAAMRPRVQGASWVSVDWDTWKVRADAHGLLGETVAAFEMTPAEGVDAFRWIVEHEVPAQVINSTGDLSTRYAQWVQFDACIDSSTEITRSPPHDGRSRQQRIAEAWEEVLGREQIGFHDNFFDLGGNSLSALQLVGKLAKDLALQVPILSLFEAPTIAALTSHLFADEPGVGKRRDSFIDRRRRVAAQKTQGGVAIIGMSGRFPGAPTVDAYWEMLRSGGEGISRFSDEALIAAGVAPAELTDSAYVKARPVLEDIKGFDAAFFGYNPREAELMDPQHRLFLECAWEALENTGYDPDRYEGLIGVFGGSNISSYLMHMVMDSTVRCSLGPYQGEYQAVIGNDKDSLTTSVSYKLNLRGPSFSVQTFCSTSLVATHLACQSLLHGESDMALAGGVSVRVPDVTGYFYREGGMESPDGRCRAFDAKARGTLFGDGVAIVVLKRFEDACEDGDTIYAVIRGSAVNNDGALKIGYTAPSVIGQAEVVAAALEAAGMSAADIGYVEAHGTGTTLGDPIEVASLTRAFRRTTDRVRFCRLGSVKPNIGHLDRAAGVASLIKVIKALEDGLIPPSINFDEPNPEIDFEQSPFVVNASLTPWPRGKVTRRAGVNSLGMGGTNAHVVVEEAPLAEATSQGRGMYLLVLSARTGEALEEATRRLAAYLGKKREVDLADVAYTLQVGRKALEYRRAVVCGTFEEAITALAGSSSGTLMGRISVEQNGLDLSMDVDRLQWWVIGREATMNEEQDLKSLLEQVGRQWISGVKVDWSGLYGTERRRRVPLPTYPFEHKRYWIETKAGGAASAQGLLAQEPEKKSDIAEWFYVPSWKRSFSTEAEGSRGGTWLVLGEGELASAVAERLRERGVQVVMVEAGERFAAIARDRYRIRPAEREDYGAVLAAVRACGGRVEQIVHLWLTEPSARWSAAGEDAVSAALERGFLSLLALAQALGEQPGEFQRVTIVTSELQDVASGEGVCAAKALAIGPCLVIPQEYRQIRCRNIDVAVHELQEPTETFLARLAAELRRETEETVVALRGADRWVQEVARARLPAIRDEHGLRARGVYLITGGLGGLGLAMAEYLHRAVDARLVLVGRTIGRHLERVEALRRAGAELLVRSADVSDRVQLAAVVEEAEARFGAVHGVIHAAGAPPSGLIQRKTRPMAESVMRPKVYGVLALAEVLRDRKLDFLCLFSSVSSMTGGGPGQIDYCAANAFMDAYARQHFHEHGMTFSIAWGEWQWNAWEEGLLGFPAEARRYFIEKRRAFGLSFDEGTEAFGRILRHRIPNTFVATQDFAEMVEGSKNFSITTILEAEKRIGGRRPMHPRPALAVSYVAPASEAERRLAQIWGDLLGFSEVGIHDNFFDLGGNSLLGVDLIARIGREFELAVPAHLLYQAPTIASLAVALGMGEARAVGVEEDWTIRTEKRREKLRRMRRGV